MTSGTGVTNAGTSAHGPAPAADLTGIPATSAREALRRLEICRAEYQDSDERAARTIAQATIEMGLVPAHLRALLVLADMSIRKGDVMEAAHTIETIRARAESAGARYVVARSHFLLAVVHHSIGDSATARINGIRSVELLPEDAPTQVLIDHLCTLAVAYGPGRRSEHCHVRALDLANAIGDSSRAIVIHNALSYFAWQQDDIMTASRHAASMVELSRVRNIRLKASELDTIARVHMMYGNYAQALTVLKPVVPDLGRTVTHEEAERDALKDLDPKPYALPEAVLAAAEAHRHLNDFEGAQQLLTFALSLAQTRGMVITEGRALKEQSLLYADQRDFQRAYEAHCDFHRVTTTTYSDEKEARAQLVQATYEAAESLRDIEQFRELAMRDALTGLHNRRHIDQQLELLTTDPQHVSQPLSVAIADADFFKRINDELSHAVGDTVLQQLATTLLGALEPGEMVGRLGGEEFALIFPGAGLDIAVRRCETIRAAVEGADWAPMTKSLRVTVSIGVACSPAGRLTAAELLAIADRNLYAAKDAGRNRVLADDTA